MFFAGCSQTILCSEAVCFATPDTSRKATIMTGAVISIIDDDAATRSAIAGLMRAKGFNVSEYNSAEAFLLAGDRRDSHCIITDIQMPGLNGIELKQQLNVEGSKIPVIMITARVEQQLHSLALGSGAFGLLRKPFKARELIECVERALAGPPRC